MRAITKSPLGVQCLDSLNSDLFLDRLGDVDPVGMDPRLVLAAGHLGFAVEFDVGFETLQLRESKNGMQKYWSINR